MKRIIIQFQEIVTLLNKKFPNKNWEKETLGSLIDILKNYCINDSTIIKHLKDFNDLRIKTIHKLFDIAFEIKDVEKEISSKLTPSSYYEKIIIPLGMYFHIIINKNIEIKDTVGQIPQETKMFIDKLNEEIEKEYSNFSNFKKEDIIKNIKI